MKKEVKFSLLHNSEMSKINGGSNQSPQICGNVYIGVVAGFVCTEMYIGLGDKENLQNL